jgi:hypothetical protein
MATAREAIGVQARLKDDFTRPLRGVSRSIGTFTKGALGGFGRLIKAATSFRGLIIGIGSAYVIRSLSRLVTETAKLGDQFQKLAIRTGTSTEFLSEMKFAAEQSGVGFESLSKAITRGQRALGDYTLFGLKEAKDSFAALGPEVVAAVEAGEQFEDILPKIATALSQVASDSEKATLAQKLFGRAGAELLPLFEDGARGIEKLREEARELGLGWDRLSSDQAAEFNDALNRMEKSFEALKNQIVIGMFPALTDLFNAVTEFLRDHKGDIIEFFRTDIPDAISSMVGSADKIEHFFNKIQLMALETQSLVMRALSPLGAFSRTPPVGQPLLGIRPEHYTNVEKRIEAIAGRQAQLESDINSRAKIADFLADQESDWARDERLREEERARKEIHRAFDDMDASHKRRREGAIDAGYPTGLPTIPQWAIREAQEQRRMDEQEKRIDQFIDRFKDIYSPLTQTLDLIWSTSEAFATGLAGSLIETIKNVNNAGEAFEEFGKALVDMFARMAMESGIRQLIGLGIGAIGSIGSAAATPTAAGRTRDSPPQFSYPQLQKRQHGGVLPPGMNMLTMMHSGAHGEAYIPLEQGGRVPVEWAGGGGGGGTQVLVVNAMDSRDVHRFFVEGMQANPKLVSGVVAKAFQNSRSYRGQMYG